LQLLLVLDDSQYGSGEAPPDRDQLAARGQLRHGIGDGIEQGSSRMPDHVYKIAELTGSSTVGYEDAITKAVERACKTLRHVKWFNVIETRGEIEDGKVAHWQVTLKIGFTLEG
jgi:flavin-binding protein dodecin